jgi:hypothetical protein
MPKWSKGTSIYELGDRLICSCWKIFKKKNFRRQNIEKTILWSYGSWICNFLCNQFLSPLTLWGRTPLRWSVLDTTLCDKIYDKILDFSIWQGRQPDYTVLQRQQLQYTNIHSLLLCHNWKKATIKCTLIELWAMVFIATFNTISPIPWWSVLKNLYRMTDKW